MARYQTFILLAMSSQSRGLTTCPGFPGFCSESFPGQSCQVVCDAGRNNVPLCQDDGTWTDIPRCVEHEPGVEEQIPGLCPGISGYCSTGFLHKRCQFDCTFGPDIDSVCTADGTWAPYPTCQGDVRELRDGCDGCPGPKGRARNRTAEALLNQNIVSDRRIPKTITSGGGRKNIPSFAGNINIGPLPGRENKAPTRQQQPRFNDFNRQQQFSQAGRQQQRQQQAFPQQNNRQQFQQQGSRQQQQQFSQQPRQQQQQFQQQQRQQQTRPSSLFAAQFPSTTARPQPRRQPPPPPPAPRQQQQQPRQPQQSGQSSLSLFEQIKARAQGNGDQSGRSPDLQPQLRQQQPRAQARPRQQQSGPGGPGGTQQTFGVFESVDLSGGLGGPSGPSPPSQQNFQEQFPRQQQRQGDFFGEFPSVNLQ